MTWSFRSSAACAALALIALAGCGGDNRSPVERHTQFGVVVGSDDSRPPAPIVEGRSPSRSRRSATCAGRRRSTPTPGRHPSATAFGNACVQYGRIYGPGANNRHDATIGTTLNQAVGSEDCLYLNIWRPADPRGDLPVIVFVHGGSNVSGYTADPVYDGAALAKTADAVVVTVNYRARHLRLPQPAAAQDRDRAPTRTRATSRCSTSSRR